MSHSEAPISITVKSPAGSLITVRAESGEQLDALVAEAYSAISSAVNELESNIRGTTSAPLSPAQVASALGGNIVSNDDAGWSTPPTTSTTIGGKACPHGRMTAIQGTGKDGKLYRGYFCAAQKGALDKCKNVYVRVGTPEWNTFVPDQVK